VFLRRESRLGLFCRFFFSPHAPPSKGLRLGRIFSPSLIGDALFLAMETGSPNAVTFTERFQSPVSRL